MTDEQYAELDKRLARLERLTVALMKVQWDRRGQAKGEAAKVEKELESFWDEYLDSHKL